jgi:hypothetical protein
MYYDSLKDRILSYYNKYDWCDSYIEYKTYPDGYIGVVMLQFPQDKGLYSGMTRVKYPRLYSILDHGLGWMTVKSNHPYGGVGFLLSEETIPYQYTHPCWLRYLSKLKKPVLATKKSLPLWKRSFANGWNEIYYLKALCLCPYLFKNNKVLWEIKQALHEQSVGEKIKKPQDLFKDGRNEFNFQLISPTVIKKPSEWQGLGLPHSLSARPRVYSLAVLYRKILKEEVQGMEDLNVTVRTWLTHKGQIVHIDCKDVI